MRPLESGSRFDPPADIRGSGFPQRKPNRYPISLVVVFCFDGRGPRALG